MYHNEQPDWRKKSTHSEISIDKITYIYDILKVHYIEMRFLTSPCGMLLKPNLLNHCLHLSVRYYCSVCLGFVAKYPYSYNTVFTSISIIWRFCFSEDGHIFHTDHINNMYLNHISWNTRNLDQYNKICIVYKCMCVHEHTFTPTQRL